MKYTAADLLMDTLIDWKVDTIFGMPGDGINGFMEALRKRQNKIRFIQVRHEESAAFMACGYAKFTGHLGVCIATSGPGGIHLLNGLYDAKFDGAPVLAITGMQFHDLLNTHSQQDVELDKLFEDVCVYNTRVMGPAHVRNVTDIACRTALSYRGVAHITMPIDTQDTEIGAEHWSNGSKRSKRNISHHTWAIAARSARLPDHSDLRHAAEILNQGNKTVILAGRGALGATDELEELAEKLGAPIVKPLLGKACVPDDSPYTTGGIGLLGTKPSQEALEDCDTLLMVGTSFPYLEFYPKPGQARGIQIDLDPARIGLRFPVEIGLVGDCKKTLREIISLVEFKRDRSFLTQAQNGMRQWNHTMSVQASEEQTPMKPQVVAHALSEKLPFDAIVTCDSGTIATWWARHIQAKRGQMHTCSGNLATMACGLPYAIAAQIAFPDRPVVAFVGDGGLSMLMAELATCVKYKLPIKIVVIKNNSLGQIKWEQMVFQGNPEYGCELQPIDFALVARACGARGVRLENPKNAKLAVEDILSDSQGPVVLEAVVDPFEPPMPAKISAEQVLKFATSLIRGEPNRERIAITALSDKVREAI